MDKLAGRTATGLPEAHALDRQQQVESANRGRSPKLAVLNSAERLRSGSAGSRRPKADLHYIIILTINPSSKGRYA